jgi:hypothetical protein
MMGDQEITQTQYACWAVPMPAPMRNKRRGHEPCPDHKDKVDPRTRKPRNKRGKAKTAEINRDYRTMRIQRYAYTRDLHNRSKEGGKNPPKQQYK